jgi:hypothetical protein
VITGAGVTALMDTALTDTALMDTALTDTALTDTAVRTAKAGERDGKLADEKGLCLLVTATGHAVAALSLIRAAGQQSICEDPRHLYNRTYLTQGGVR